MTKAESADAPTLAHIHIYCTELEPMLAFWIEAFDARLALRRKFGNDEGAEMHIGAIPLYVQQTKVAAGKAHIVSYDHIALRVGDVEAALQKAAAAPGATLDRGIQPSIQPSSGVAHTAFVRGPEGIRVELIQPPKQEGADAGKEYGRDSARHPVGP